MMWRRSLSRPGFCGLPAASQASRDWPPFQARVVKPRISTLTPQRSSVRARMSAQVAATVIGRPRIEPELSSSSVTTVSRKLVSFSRLNDSGCSGSTTTRESARGIEHAFFEIELPGAVLLRQQAALQPVGEARDHALQVRELLVEIAAQALQLLRLAQVLGVDRLVELGGERLVVGAARLVEAVMARAPGLVRRLRIAHVGVVRHVGRVGVERIGGALGQFIGRHLGLLEGHALGVFGFLGLAVARQLVVAALAVAVALVLLVRIAAAVVAHVERVEQVVHGVAEAPLVLDELLEPVEIAAGAVLDPRPPQVDQPARCGRRRLPGEPLAHHQGERILDRGIGTVGDLVELAAVKAVVEHGGEIVRDAFHAARTDRFDARLLDRLEHGARLLAAGLQPAVDRRVMAGDALARSNRRGPARSPPPGR